MEDLRQRIVDRVMAEVDPASLSEETRGVDLGRRQAQMTLVNQLVAAFARGVAAEGVQLSAGQRQQLLGQVVGDVLNYQPRRELAKSLEVPPTPERLVRRNTWNEALVAYLRACMDARRSVLVTGEAGAGKTTLLRVLMGLAPGARVIAFERGAPLETSHDHVVHLHGDDPALFDWALRLLPDWLVFDEVTSRSALPAMQAMAAVPSLSTIWGPSARAGLGRLVEWLLDAAPGLSADAARRLVADHVDVVVNVVRHYAGQHQVTEVVEVRQDPAAPQGMQVVTLVALNEAGKLAATGTSSAYVTGAFLLGLPQVEVPAPEPIVAPPAPDIAAPPVSQPEPVSPPPPPPQVEPEPVPGPEPAGRGLLGRLAGRRGVSSPASAAARGAALSAATELTDYSGAAAQPLVQKMTTYLLGDDMYDESFNIETDGDYVGEMGVGLGQVVDEGPPRLVSGVEIWMFDKVSLQSPTANVLIESAYDDESVREKLAARGRVLAARPGQRVMLGEGTLRIEARVASVETSGDGLALEQITLELVAWLDEGAN